MISLQVRKEESRKKHRLVKKIRLRKYSGCPTALKNRANEENKPYKHYTPCTCEPICGDNCTCLTNENCCEKYCGYVIYFPFFAIENILKSDCKLYFL